jgi:hypothetical protein
MSRAERFEMRKLFLIFIALLVIFAASVAGAAGTVTPSLVMTSLDGNTLVIKLACVSDAANGSVPATAITPSLLSWQAHNFPVQYWFMGYSIYEVWTVAGSPAPDAADITIVDGISAILYTEVAVIAAAGTTEGTVDKYRTVTSQITVSVANQATNDAEYDIYIKLLRYR